jgi:hypothetical protein
MTDLSQVRQTGSMFALDGVRVRFGVDHGHVTVAVADRSVVLDMTGQDGFAREFHRAVFEAEAQAERACRGTCCVSEGPG